MRSTIKLPLLNIVLEDKKGKKGSSWYKYF